MSSQKSHYFVRLNFICNNKELAHANTFPVRMQYFFLNNLKVLEVHHVTKILCRNSFMFSGLSISFDVKTMLTAFIWKCTTNE